MLLTKATRDPLMGRQTSENRFLFFRWCFSGSLCCLHSSWGWVNPVGKAVSDSNS